ncbi:MAG: hypothetical protein WC716_09775 [Chitinophagaceae bacterium]|jgi:hypothetical protein
MIKIEKGYRFQSTGREMNTYGFEGFSIIDGSVRVGFDTYPEFFDDESKTFTREFSDEEMKELAEFMIVQWKQIAKMLD